MPQPVGDRFIARTGRSTPSSRGAITVPGHSLSMVFAEKIVTAVQRGTANTRWRDYADIAFLSAAHDANGDELAASTSIKILPTSCRTSSCSPDLPLLAQSGAYMG